MIKLTIDGIEIMIGKNKFENQEILSNMNNKDTWFHIYNLPSPHLMAIGSYKNFSKKQLYLIALELKKNSKYKKINNIEIMYTLRENIILTNTPGKVIVEEGIKIINV
jgi:predicted ribosome quality control (RQC) complex YloA/Tae2 family protein